MWTLKVMDYIAKGHRNSEQEQRVREYNFGTMGDAEAFIKACNGYSTKLIDPEGNTVYEHMINKVIELDEETQDLPEWD
jgi:hypothetical protein